MSSAYILCENNEYKAYLTNLKLDSGLKFDLGIKYKNGKKESISMKNMHLKVNIFKTIFDLLVYKRMNPDLRKSLFGLIDASINFERKSPKKGV